MGLTRRELLAGAFGALVLAACSDDGDGDGAATTTAPSTTAEPPPAPELPGPPFTLGVASGDPDETSVVLWTRLAPEPTGGGGMPDEDVDVLWELAADEGFAEVVASGTAVASPEHGHSVHVVADGLEPGTWYWYRFRVGEHTSPVGRTRTAPRGDDAGELRFAFGSCQHWEDGYWTAHEHLAEEDLDLVVWLGDYIYEGGVGEGGVRRHDGPEPTTLEAYRNRYGLYKSDPGLQAAHAARPWLIVWDDHEVENNYAGSTSEDRLDPEEFLARRAAAYKAWWEHMPVRLDPPDGPDFPIHRSLAWGGLATFFAVDGRQHRSDQPCGRDLDLGAGCEEREDPARTMLGEEQEAWLAEAMPASQSTWNVLANQVIVTPAPIPAGDTTLFNLDQWDGYPAARERLLDVLARTTNPVVITGDIHASAVAQLRRGDEVVAAELVGTSISSTFPDAFVDIFETAAVSAGAEMADASRRGYVRCTVTPERFLAEYRYVATTAEPTSPIETGSAWVVEAGTRGVRPA